MGETPPSYTFDILEVGHTMKEQDQIHKQQQKQGRKRRNEPKHAEKSNEQKG